MLAPCRSFCFAVTLMFMLSSATALHDRRLQQTDTPGYTSPLWGLNNDYTGQPRSVTGTNGAVAADTGTCSQVGLDILQAGGNAVDAGVAVALCQGVANPESSGIGGGGFIMIRTPNGTYEVIDAREQAPAAATQDMYINKSDASTVGGLAIAVSLELKGLEVAHERHGVLPCSQLVQPAIELARGGIQPNPYLISTISSLVSTLEDYPGLRDAFLIEMPNGSYRAPMLGERCCQRPEYADTLDSIADMGSAAVYNPDTAATLAEEIKAAGGIITAEDFLTIEPKIKAAVVGEAFGVSIVTAPPPSSGTLSIPAMRILEQLGERGQPLATGGVQSDHYLIEAFKHVYALRTELGDPDFVNNTALDSAIASADFALSLAAMVQIKTRHMAKEGEPGASGTPCSLKDGTCLTDRKATNNEEYGTTLILSVDDEPINHMVIEECISGTGYKLHTMTSGKDALAWIDGCKVLPDLILLDCMMPNMSGHEFCLELRKTVPDAVVPVIMVSAKNDEANIVEGLTHGCNDFVSKPIKRAELLARIKAHLRVKSDATWVQSIVKGVLTEDSEAMKILESILPESIITRIQDGHQVIGDSHEHVVILFSDIVGFSTMASTMSAVEVFLMLSNLYYAFDRLVDKYGVYKVETIGDGYMLASGHDEDEEKAKMGTPLERMFMMAEAMLDAMKQFKSPDGKSLRIRVGIHCGSAYAGVIGMKCPRYCFLGDTVNTASRMESNSFPLCVHVSEAVVQKSTDKDKFVCLGERQIKGKGIMTTYLLKFGEWEEAVAHYNAKKELDIGIPMSPTGLARQATRKISGLGRTATLTRQATTSLSNAGGKRAQALEGLKQQVEDLKGKLQTERAGRKENNNKVKELEQALDEARTELQAEKLLLQQVQKELAQAESAPSSPTRMGSIMPAGAGAVEPIVAARIGATLGYTVRNLLADLGMEEFATKFETEKVRLHVLLGMDHDSLTRLGVTTFGERETIINGVYEYLRAYLRAAEPFSASVS